MQRRASALERMLVSYSLPILWDFRSSALPLYQVARQLAGGRASECGDPYRRSLRSCYASPSRQLGRQDQSGRVGSCTVGPVGTEGLSWPPWSFIRRASGLGGLERMVRVAVSTIGRNPAPPFLRRKGSCCPKMHHSRDTHPHCQAGCQTAKNIIIPIIPFSFCIERGIIATEEVIP